MIFPSLVASPIQERNLNEPNKLNWTNTPPSWLMVMMRTMDWTNTKWPMKTSWDTSTRNLNGFMESSDWYMNDLKMLWMTVKPDWLNLNWMDRPKMVRLSWQRNNWKKQLNAWTRWLSTEMHTPTRLPMISCTLWITLLQVDNPLANWLRSLTLCCSLMEKNPNLKIGCFWWPRNLRLIMITMTPPSFVVPMWLVIVMEKLASTSHPNSKANPWTHMKTLLICSNT